MRTPKTLTFVPIKLPPRLVNFEELQRANILRIARSMLIDQKFFMERKYTVIRRSRECAW